MTQRPAVLIINDQPHVLLTLEYLARSSGHFEVLAVSSAQEAAAVIARQPVAIVMLDATMLDLNPAQACATLRQAWDAQSGQIWFITARASSLDLEEAREMGADRIFTTPFDPDLMLGLVREMGQAWSPKAIAG